MMLLEFKRCLAGLFLTIGLIIPTPSIAQDVHYFEDGFGLTLRELLPIWLNNGGDLETIDRDIPDSSIQSGESPFEHKRKRSDFLQGIVDDAQRLKSVRKFGFVSYIGNGGRVNYDFDRSVLTVCLPYFVALPSGFDYGIKSSSKFLNKIGVGNSSAILILSYSGLMAENQSCQGFTDGWDRAWFSNAIIEIPVVDVALAERYYEEFRSGGFELAFYIAPETRSQKWPFVGEVSRITMWLPNADGSSAPAYSLQFSGERWEITDASKVSGPSLEELEIGFNSAQLLDLVERQKWAGQSIGDSSEYSVVFSLDDAGKFQIDYPELNCGGQLGGGMIVGDTYKFNAPISYGKERCSDGVVDLRVIDEQTIGFLWRGKTEFFDRSAAVLKPIK
jgi:hypothetical protein